MVRDHLRAFLLIISGLGIICGRGSFAVGDHLRRCTLLTHLFNDYNKGYITRALIGLNSGLTVLCETKPTKRNGANRNGMKQNENL